MLNLFSEVRHMEHISAAQCASSVMDTNHLVPRAIHQEVRKNEAEILSVQQFRAMMIVTDHEGLSLSELAGYLGSTLPAASKLVNGLVELGYVARVSSPDDRRRLALSVTEAGESILEAMRLQGLSCLTDKLATLTSGERAVVVLAMDLLRQALASDRGDDAPCRG